MARDGDVEFAMGVITAAMTVLRHADSQKLREIVERMLTDACEIIAQRMRDRMPRISE